ncbi:hypothetical protein [Streptomyces sp. NPDC098781]|uniref:hypothetical protein n=1 Tax=Streptomyces sp. NPDC098781 TaxID=3366097 RepID=UPI0037F778C6
MAIPRPLTTLRRFRMRQADSYVRAMQSDLCDAGYSWVALPLHIRSALQSYHLWRGIALFQFGCRIMLAYCLTIMILASVAEAAVRSPTIVVLFFLSIYGIMCSFSAPSQMRRSQLVAECAAAIHVVAGAAKASGRDRPDAVRQVSVAMRTVERAIFRAGRSHQTVPRGRWFRHALLRRHAERVVATLRAAETELDGPRPDAALENLTGLLLRIAANSAAGRTGVLLPDSLTENHKDERVRNTELLRIAGVVLMILAAASGVVALKVPDIAAVTIIAGVGVLSAIALLGSGWTKAVSVIELLKGGP